jgi:hypothetical protein
MIQVHGKEAKIIKNLALERGNVSKKGQRTTRV